MEDVKLRVLPYVRRRDDLGSLSGDDGAGGTFDFSTNTETEQYGADAQVEVGFDAFGQRHTFLRGRRGATRGLGRPEPVRVGRVREHLHRRGPRRETWGLFVQQEIGLREDLHMLLGVRRDEIHYDGSGFQETDFGTTQVDVDEEPSVWSPRASLTWRVTEPIGLYVGYARGFRSANVQETVSLFGVDPNDPQKSESYEIGGKYRAGNCSLNLALFWMNVKDEILFDPITFENTNLDRVQHRGVELSGDVRPLEWLELYASYTFDDVRIESGVPTSVGPPATFTNAGRMPITPEHRGALGATVFLPHGFEVGRGCALHRLAAARERPRQQLDLRPAAFVRRVRRARGWRHPLGAVACSLDAALRNLTDNEYAEFGGGPRSAAPPGYFPSPERNWVLGVRMEYRR